MENFSDQLSKESIDNVIKRLNEVRQLNSAGKEYWHARDIHKILGYPKWDQFQDVILRAIVACRVAKADPQQHFQLTGKMLSLGKGAERTGNDYFLSRPACYWIAMEGDSKKPEIAAAKGYFVIKTRMQEIQEIEQRDELTDDEKRLFLRKEVASHNKKLASAAKAAGVITTLDYAIFKNYGYKGTYDGLDAAGRHKKMGLKTSQKILDHMGSTELAVNLFCSTQTEEKLRKDRVQGKANANRTHFEVGQEVRKAIIKIGGTMPEDLPPAPAIREVEKRLKKGGKGLPGDTTD